MIAKVRRRATSARTRSMVSFTSVRFLMIRFGFLFAPLQSEQARPLCRRGGGRSVACGENHLQQDDDIPRQVNRFAHRSSPLFQSGTEGIAPKRHLRLKDQKRIIPIEMKATTTRKKPVAADHAAVLTRALLRTARLLDLSQKDMAQIVGVSPASMSRLVTGSRPLEPDSKEGECALLLIRIFRSLDALLGGREADVRAWF